MVGQQVVIFPAIVLGAMIVYFVSGRSVFEYRGYHFSRSGSGCRLDMGFVVFPGPLQTLPFG